MLEYRARDLRANMEISPMFWKYIFKDFGILNHLRALTTIAPK